MKASPAWRSNEAVLTSVPGVSSTAARTLLAELPELGTLDRCKIAAPVGVAPLNRDSVTMRGRRAVQGGLGGRAADLARAGATPAPSRRRTPCQGPAKAALTACTRRLLTILNAVVRSRQPWKAA